MEARRIVPRGRQRHRLLRLARRCDDPHLRNRYLIVVHTAAGWGAARIAAALGCCERTVSRARARWHEGGEAALADGRSGNGRRRAGPAFAEVVRLVPADGPAAFGHRRPTWTQRLLADTARRYTGTAVSATAVGRVPARLGARRGPAKPVPPPCPWGEARERRRLAMIRGLVESLPPDEAAVWEDEVDVDLNPRVGADWTLPGQQRAVPTPGKNVERSIAGAMDAKTDRLVWVRGRRKDSGLFVALLERLLAAYAGRKVIHVIPDNYGIHTSSRTRQWLARHGSKFRLHFLPPYCPDDNRIERKVWREFHANVTTNHDHPTMDGPMDAATRWLTSRNRRLTESREAI
jgi:transposase